MPSPCPATSLWDNLAISARRYPDKAGAGLLRPRASPTPKCSGQAERLAARLHALGVRKGDRVMLDMQNCPQLVIAHFAILRANAVVVPVNPMNRAEELKHYITDPDAQGRDHHRRPGRRDRQGRRAAAAGRSGWRT